MCLRFVEMGRTVQRGVSKPAPFYILLHTSTILCSIQYTFYREPFFLGAWRVGCRRVVVILRPFGLVPQVHPAFFLVWTWTEHGTLVEAPPRSPSTTYLLDTTRQTRLAAAATAAVEAAAAVAHRRHTVGRKAENGPVIYFLSSYNGNANFYIQVPSGAKADEIEDIEETRKWSQTAQ